MGLIVEIGQEIRYRINYFWSYFFFFFL